MEAFSALLAFCAGNSPVTGEFSTQRPVTRRFDVFFDLRLYERLNKQSWGWWFEMPSCPLWRHIIYEISRAVITPTHPNGNVIIWRKFRYCLHWKFSFWSLSVHPMITILSKWQHFRLSDIGVILQYMKHHPVIKSWKFRQNDNIFVTV